MKTKIYLLMATLFLSGVICGSLVTFLAIRAEIYSTPTKNSMELSAKALRFLNLRLRLSAEQEAKIEPILMDAQRDISPLRAEMRSHVLALMTAYNPRIEAELTPNQRATFRKFTHKLESNLSLDLEEVD